MLYNSLASAGWRSSHPRRGSCETRWGRATCWHRSWAAWYAWLSYRLLALLRANCGRRRACDCRPHRGESRTSRPWSCSRPNRPWRGHWHRLRVRSSRLHLRLWLRLRLCVTIRVLLLGWVEDAWLCLVDLHRAWHRNRCSRLVLRLHRYRLWLSTHRRRHHSHGWLGLGYSGWGKPWWYHASDRTRPSGAYTRPGRPNRVGWARPGRSLLRVLTRMCFVRGIVAIVGNATIKSRI